MACRYCINLPVGKICDECGASGSPKPILVFSDLIGRTLYSCVAQRGCDREDEAIIFTLDDGQKFKLYHSQDCCESVRIDDICGELEDLVGSTILQAEENTNHNENTTEVRESEDAHEEYQDESYTWTFYRIATMKGQVVIRWYGSSNGYYSESVSFGKVEG
jgi:hypothetical protein